MSQPYIAGIIHQSGILLRMVIKDKNIKQRGVDFVSHLGGTKLLAVINAPVAWVFEGKRFVYIREIRDREITDFINEDLVKSSLEIQKRFFFALGVALSEAHILGMSDRRRNLVVSLRRLEEFDINHLSGTENRAIFNIDRENALTPRFLELTPVEDVSEAASVLKAWRDYVLPYERYIFDTNLSFYLDGFMEGYRQTREYYRFNKNTVDRRINEIVGAEGSPYASKILERLNLRVGQVEIVVNNLRVEIERLFNLPPAQSDDDFDEAMTVEKKDGKDRAMTQFNTIAEILVPAIQQVLSQKRQCRILLDGYPATGKNTFAGELKNTLVNAKEPPDSVVILDNDVIRTIDADLLNKYFNARVLIIIAPQMKEYFDTKRLDYDLSVLLEARMPVRKQRLNDRALNLAFESGNYGHLNDHPVSIELPYVIGWIGFNLVVDSSNGWVIVKNQIPVEKRDDAQMSQQSKTGGIDLTSDKALTVQNNGQAIKFHIDPALLARWQNAPGVTFDILISDLPDIRSWLGVPSGKQFRP